jgi:ABC-type polysaccharide/polyol phosphate transport system ATPase subunit
MSSPPVIRLAGVGKRYWQLSEQAMLLRSVMPMWRPTRTELWALRGVDLTIERGETVGMIGRNGAGKTTLLRLLAGVTQPSEGRVLVSGRIAPLISVGVGFHKEMSGRENVYVNGMLLGLSRRDIEARFDQIVAFAELEKFIDTPVKFYSSGMFMRLGFAVAVCADPDVLLVDEVLAVGDVSFQVKCFQRMREIQAQGTTIVLVSHSTHAIRLMCPRTVLVDGGEVKFDGDTQEAISRHHELLSTSATEAGPGGAVRVLGRALVGRDGPTYHPGIDEPVSFRARVEFQCVVEDPQVVFEVVSQAGTAVFGLRTFAGRWRRFEAGETAEIEVPFRCRLGGDTYRLTMNILDGAGEQLYTDHEGLVVYVAPRSGTWGVVDLAASVSVDGQPLAHELDLLLGGSGADADGRPAGSGDPSGSRFAG